jgi:hypothetical protein
MFNDKYIIGSQHGRGDPKKMCYHFYNVECIWKRASNIKINENS